jgi:hypothetical protein
MSPAPTSTAEDPPVVGDGVGEGDGLGEGDGEGLGVGFGVGEGVGLGVGVGAGVGVGVGEGEPAAGAEFVVNGHEHDYERFAPLAANGSIAAVNGTREFVVGTGGASLRGFGTIATGSQVRNGATNGVIKFTLSPTGYSWQFLPIAGKTFTDSGTGACS